MSVEQVSNRGTRIRRQYGLAGFMLFPLLLCGSCNSPYLNPGGNEVTVLHSKPACTLLSDVTVVTNHSQLGVPRSKSIIRQELETLARNAAADLGGTAIVPASPLVNGERTFSVYRCK